MIYELPPRDTFGKEKFAYWENFLSAEDINQILSAPEWGILRKGTVGTADGRNIFTPEFRDTDIAWYGITQSNKHIWEKIAETVAEVNSRFFRFDLRGFYEHAQLGLYHADTGGHYDWHTDDDIKGGRVPRKLSVALMLDDPTTFEGGQLELKCGSDRPITVEQKRGRAWFFPSYILHRVTPVTKGIRRSLVLWVGGPEFT